MVHKVRPWSGKLFVGVPQAIGSDNGTTAFWNTQRGMPESEPLTGGVFALCKRRGSSEKEAGTGTFVATAKDDLMRIFKGANSSLSGAAPVAFFRAPASIRSLACSGANIAVGCSNGEVLLRSRLLFRGL